MPLRYSWSMQIADTPHLGMAAPGRTLDPGSVLIYDNDVISTGAYGKVCKAMCGQLPCAAKLLYDHDAFLGSHSFIHKFQNQCQLLSTISHPNIVQYLGTTTNPCSRSPVLLTELMDETLTRFLEGLTGPLPYHSQLNICHDVASALAYLHSNDIIHREVSSHHVLLSGEGSKAKLCGFGGARQMGTIAPTTSALTPPLGYAVYMAPEALTSDTYYSSKLDCFSHGVLTLQIITRNFPNPGDASRYVEDPSYPNHRVIEQFPEVQRRRKDIDLVEPSHPLLPIVLQCLKDRDTERLSADELCEKLAALKGEPRYTHSVEHTINPTQGPQQEHTHKNSQLEKASCTPYSAVATPRSSVQIYNEVLHVGRYGKFFKAKYRQVPCAAKILHDILFATDFLGIHRQNLFTKFQRECQILSTISHPNIVQCLGTTTDPLSPAPVLLMELVGEDLAKFLKRSTGPLPYHFQVNICHDVASALAYLHSNAIIHRNLSSYTVLLSEGSRAKLGGFERAKQMVKITPTAPLPELIEDCFSHGLLTLKIITRNSPIEVDQHKDIYLVELSHPLLPIVLQCLKDRDTERPSADELCERLAALKGEPRYTHSVEYNTQKEVHKEDAQTQRLQDEVYKKDAHIQRLQEEVYEKDAHIQRLQEEVYKKDTHVQRLQDSLLQEEIRIKDAQLEKSRAELQRVNEEKASNNAKEEIHKKDSHTQRLQEKICMKDARQEKARTELQRANEEKASKLAKRPSHEELHDALYPIRTDWLKLGFYLKCDYPSLQNIETKERDDEICIIKMTALVLRRGDTDWNQVIQAVRKAGHEHQAQVITKNITEI